MDPNFLKTLPHAPGVYRMIDAEGAVIYVGKAKDLQKRVTSYFQRGNINTKSRVLVEQIANIEVTVTHTEKEALILECTLIKNIRPRYNVLLKDDKSYPFLHFSAHASFPRLTIYRGAKKPDGHYLGPYPNATAAYESLHVLQKLFAIRSCKDSYFNHRARPCLQYQIKRCSAPCVNYIDKESYQSDVKLAMLFLQGKSEDVLNELATRMEAASASLAFERAAEYRDKIALLREVQEQQYVAGSKGDVDVVTALLQQGVACAQVLVVRRGQIMGHKTFFPSVRGAIDEPELLSQFLAQYYLAYDQLYSPPKEILINQPLADRLLLQETITDHLCKAVRISSQPRGDRLRWLQMGIINTTASLEARITSRMHMLQRVEELQAILSLAALPQRLECFDVSHTQGEATVASCVVFDGNGPLTSDYRRFNIKDITPGDDYAALTQAITRRYLKIKEGEGKLPDILFIDGGKGQLHTAHNALSAIGVYPRLLIGVAKGEGRKPGLETLWLDNGERSIQLPTHHPALHLIQHIRDEAHRFAITGHRQRRHKARQISQLEEIPGIGAKRRRELLLRFGGLQAIKQASIEELAKVPGISVALAQRLADALADHPKTIN